MARVSLYLEDVVFLTRRAHEKRGEARSEFSSASATNSSGCEEALIDKPTSADELPTYGVFDELTSESETGSVQKSRIPAF